jgi:hypothetical protein
MSKNGAKYDPETTIGFRYLKKQGQNGIQWHLVEQIIDPDVIEAIGAENFYLPYVTEIPPQSILRALYRALGRHKLDGGAVDELPSDGTGYGVKISIKRRIVKPDQ